MASSVEVTGIKELDMFIDDLSTKGNQIIKTTLARTAQSVEKDWKSNLRQAGNRKTGDLEASIYKDVKGYTAEVGSESGVSRLIEYGSRPHKIRIKNASILFDGVDFFGKEVNHPGYKGNPALTRSFFKNVGLNGRKFINDLIKGYKAIK